MTFDTAKQLQDFIALCSAGDEIVSSRTIYGGTYALMKNLLTRFGVGTKFVDITDLSAVEAAITPKTRVLYCETTSNPLLEVADILALSRMAKHGENALYLARQFQSVGLPVYYPGLENHPQHDLATNLMNPGFGYGGMMAVDVGDMETAGRLLMRLQDAGVGYLAVSLGYFKTLFSAPGQSTSSEIPVDEQQSMGLCEGLIRISVGLDNDIRSTWEVICTCLADVGVNAVEPVPSNIIEL